MQAPRIKTRGFVLMSQRLKDFIEEAHQKQKARSTVELPVIDGKVEKSRSAYINEAERRVKLSQQLLAKDPRNHIQIDGGYGDYCMKLFRIKDKMKYAADIPTLYTPEMRKKIIRCFPPGTMNQSKLDEVIGRQVTIPAAAPVQQPAEQPEEMNKTVRQNIEQNMSGYITFKQYPHKRPDLTKKQYSAVIPRKEPLPESKTPVPTSRRRNREYLFRALHHSHR